ncbi:C40 family peptidase [Flavobacterium silvaticum]|uniref:Uncharacterized protein n=1 Tax=Flavobacterium silvaticum TaxID=1852020 RepID=A0A972FN34_9FLAO|nr:hypothetical protein [Flavobacterium silvaticum]NMH28727.1 hypothetical protein [Flavobacterium silvaticum]
MSTPFSPKNLRDADILLYRGTSWLAKAIRFFDGTDYNHTSIFVGNDQVVEAVAKGVTRRTIDESIHDAVKVSVFRLLQRPDDMSPVIAVVPRYEGNRYGYEQLLLLALICSMRSVRVNNVVARFFRRVLEGAAGALLNLTAGNRQALICSEFVYRCYDEALPEIKDIYAIQLAYGSEKAMQFVLENNSHLYDNQSLVAYYYGLGRDMIANNAVPFLELPNSKTLEIVKVAHALEEEDAEMEALFFQVEQSYAAEDYILDKADELALKQSLDKFVFALATTVNPATEMLTSPPLILRDFLSANANFVTPGDFYRATNLQNLGDIKHN